jgi:hypothetical protein
VTRIIEACVHASVNRVPVNCTKGGLQSSTGIAGRRSSLSGLHEGSARRQSVVAPPNDDEDNDDEDEEDDDDDNDDETHKIFRVAARGRKYVVCYVQLVCYSHKFELTYSI